MADSVYIFNPDGRLGMVIVDPGPNLKFDAWEKAGHKPVVLPKDAHVDYPPIVVGGMARYTDFSKAVAQLLPVEDAAFTGKLIAAAEADEAQKAVEDAAAAAEAAVEAGLP